MVVLAPLGVLFRSLPPAYKSEEASPPLQPKTQRRYFEPSLPPPPPQQNKGEREEGKVSVSEITIDFGVWGKTGDIQDFWLSEAAFVSVNK